jgi:hypothetical protein
MIVVMENVGLKDLGRLLSPQFPTVQQRVHPSSTRSELEIGTRHVFGHFPSILPTFIADGPRYIDLFFHRLSMLNKN